MTYVAIQGIKGSFHEIAAYKYFGEREAFTTVTCTSFSVLFKNFQQREDYYGVIAIENSVAGALLPNYALLRNSELTIVGEIYLRIQHNLLANPGATIATLREVHSHPMAILQCQDFFENHPHIQLIESQDTAWSAQQVAQSSRFDIGAIAGSLAAHQNQLSILAAGIETNKQNFTRFLVLQHKTVEKQRTQLPNKASLCFHLAHEVGRLSEILGILAQYQLNLTKIQSLPILGLPWAYFFHIDVGFSNYEHYQVALKAIAPIVSQLQILGEYQEGIKSQII